MPAYRLAPAAGARDPTPGFEGRFRNRTETIGVISREVLLGTEQKNELTKLEYSGLARNKFRFRKPGIEPESD